MRSYLRQRLNDDRIDRRVLHGTQDQGDLYGIKAHGYEGIAECKNHKTITPALLEDFKQQSLNERENADADFVMLIVHKNGVGKKNVGANFCYMSLRDLLLIGSFDFGGLINDDIWVCVTLDDACRMIEGAHENSI